PAVRGQWCPRRVGVGPDPALPSRRAWRVTPRGAHLGSSGRAVRPSGSWSREEPMTPSTSQPPGYGSDLVVDLLRAVGVEHVAINPGATFRGLHDSLVNYA